MDGPGPTRRSLLLAGGMAALLAACSAPDGRPGRVARDVEVPTGSAVSDVAGLLALSTFWVAHRGSGDTWPEHTLLAYRSALAAGAHAVEISVCSTADGVLVCHHDKSGERVLGVDRPIDELTWSELEGLAVDARRWLGPTTPLEPVARLDDVLDALGPDVVAFVEDKQGSNTGPLLDALDAQPRARERFVWKQWAGAAQVRAAKDRGYLAWGYLDTDHRDRVEEFAATFDLLGVPMAGSDELMARAVATGRPVMAWEVHYHADVARLQGLGVRGLMCSNIPYLRAADPAAADAFASGRRAAGDLPADHGQLGWSAQPALVPERSALRIQRAGLTSYLMGSLADPDRPLESVELSITWPEAVPSSGRAGVVVGLDSDAPGGQGDRGAANGYEVALDVTGSLSLHARESGRTGPALAQVQLAPVTAGVPVRLRVELGDGGVRAVVDGSTSVETADDRWRGSWLRLVKDYETGQAVEFSEVTTTLGP